MLVLDVRSAEECRAGHIPGAVGIPATELADRIDELPDDTELVVYCRGEHCILAYDTVRLPTGKLEWRLADLPVHAGDPV
ncbi:rhodanese-like domain-containing protein [Spirillospora sp. CA-128828]|uniref:rhodanese-like domain-containing protein n=1 Tax=Spirillospora sp. CA-128828 TaxID=3240033 RepID=UPI003D95027A